MKVFQVSKNLWITAPNKEEAKKWYKEQYKSSPSKGYPKESSLDDWLWEHVENIPDEYNKDKFEKHPKYEWLVKVSFEDYIKINEIKNITIIKQTLPRVETHIIKNKEKIKVLDDLCFRAKNLYNTVLYILKQCEFYKRENPHENTVNFIKHLNEYIEKYNQISSAKTEFITKENGVPSKNFDVFLIWYFKNKENNKEYKGNFKYQPKKIIVDKNENPYRELPSATSTAIIKKIFDERKSTLAALKEAKKSPGKFKGKINFSRYKHKTKGRYIVVFIGGNQVKVVNDEIQFPNEIPIKLKTNVKEYERLAEVRIIPLSSDKTIKKKYYKIEVVYDTQKINYPLDESKYIAIDLGVKNLMTVTHNFPAKSFIINGKPLLAINQYFNKKQAKLKSYIKNKGTSNKLIQLHFKRNNKVNDYIHKATSDVINYCLKNKIKYIIIGYNQGWKQNVSIGKRNNQNFVLIPHKKIIDTLRYKGEKWRIEVIVVHEQYTSKCDALSLEPIQKHEKYLGFRGIDGKSIRGLFSSATGYAINADINGSLNIMRKVVGDDFIKHYQNKIHLLTPYRVNIK